MNAKRTTKRSIPAANKTNRRRIATLSDTAVRKAVRSDPDAAPLLGAEWFRSAAIVLPKPKKAVSIRLDRDVMEWFQQQGRGYQTRINALLRAYVKDVQAQR